MPSMQDHLYPQIAEGVPVALPTGVTPVASPRTSFASNGASSARCSGGERERPSKLERMSSLSNLKATMPKGLCNALARSVSSFPLRVMIVDNSGSMQTADGARLVQDSKGKFQKLKCTRWHELQDEVIQMAEVSAALTARTDFHLLNPSRGFSAMSVCGEEWGTGEDDAALIPPLGPSADVPTFKEAIKAQGPMGSTPLTEAVMKVVSMVEPVQHELRRRGEQVAVIIATDGMPNNSRSFVNAMQTLQTLPTWVVVRLCTDDDSVVEYWNSLDAMLEAPLEVLDDVSGEADEVYAHNPFLTYAPPLHLARLFGIDAKVYDALDEARLLPSQIKELVEDMLGCAALPEPELDRAQFVDAVREALGERPTLVVDPRSGKMKPWFDLALLDRSLRPKGEQSCAIM